MLVNLDQNRIMVLHDLLHNFLRVLQVLVMKYLTVFSTVYVLQNGHILRHLVTEPIVINDEDLPFN